MRKIYIFLGLFLCFFVQIGHSQNMRVFSQYYANPYLYNPSYVGESRYTELYLTHRQQWVGVEDAPVSSALNLQVPLEKGVSFGVGIMRDKSVILENNTFNLTFGYHVGFSDRHYIKFGLSGGVGNNSIDQEALANYSDDRALMNALDNTFYLNAQFGAHYRYKDLEIGFSLPKLLKSDVIGENQFNQPAIDRLSSKLFSASYKLKLGSGRMSFKPLVLYRMIDGHQNQWEAVGIMNFEEHVWAGLGYRQEYGSTIMAGVRLMDRLKIGYAFEMGSKESANLLSGTHEFQISMRLSKKKRSLPNKYNDRARRIDQSANTKQKKTYKHVKVADKPYNNGDTQHNNYKEIQSSSETLKKEDARSVYPSLKPGHYWVARTFSSYEQVEGYVNKNLKEGYNNTFRIGYSTGLKQYLLYMEEGVHSSEKQLKLVKARFPDLWKLEIE